MTNRCQKCKDKDRLFDWFGKMLCYDCKRRTPAPGSGQKPIIKPKPKKKKKGKI